MKKIIKIGVLSVAKIQSIIMAVIGLLYGIIFALSGDFSGEFANAGAVGVNFGYLGIIILPITYAIFGFIGGLIGAYLYNVAAERIGGIEIELK